VRFITREAIKRPRHYNRRVPSDRALATPEPGPAPDLEPAVAAPPPRSLVLYDGLCGLCDRSVQFLLARDRRGVLRFAPLQGETAAAVLRRQRVAPDLATMVFVRGHGGRDERAFVRSAGAIRALAALGGPWRLAALLLVVPPPLRDAVYRWVAANRLRWFGRLESCRVPSPQVRRRFLP
jgi:predicted DCC family thiol-disulfide oxidoreductase YuxK